MKSIAIDQMDSIEDIFSRAMEIQSLEDNIKRQIKELETGLKGDITEIKRDIKELEIKLKKDITELELRSEARMSEVKVDLIKWVIGIAGAQATLIIALLKFL